MAVKILPASADDAVEMFDVGIKAFANDALSKATFDAESATPEELAEYRKWRISLSKLRMGGPNNHYFKAVDETTGSIVGYAGLNGPDTEPVPHSIVLRPKCLNSSIDDEFMVKQKATREACLGDRKDFWYVQSMLVHPDYQGRGIATKLLKHAMRGADQAGQDIYLEGTASGQSLYLRCGFEPLQDISIMSGAYLIKAMIRHPQKPDDSQG